MNDYEKYCMKFDSCKRCPLNKECENDFEKEVKAKKEYKESKGTYNAS